MVTPRWASFCPLALAAQTVVVGAVLPSGASWHGDFYAILFGVVSMRTMQRLGWQTTFLWIALFAPLTALALSLSYDVAEAVVFAVMYAGLAIFLALFTLITTRVAEARAGMRGPWPESWPWRTGRWRLRRGASSASRPPRSVTGSPESCTTR